MNYFTKQTVSLLGISFSIILSLIVLSGSTVRAEPTKITTPYSDFPITVDLPVGFKVKFVFRDPMYRGAHSGPFFVIGNGQVAIFEAQSYWIHGEQQIGSLGSYPLADGLLKGQIRTMSFEDGILTVATLQNQPPRTASNTTEFFQTSHTLRRINLATGDVIAARSFETPIDVAYIHEEKLVVYTQPAEYPSPKSQYMPPFDGNRFTLALDPSLTPLVQEPFDPDRYTWRRQIGNLCARGMSAVKNLLK